MFLNSCKASSWSSLRFGGNNLKSCAGIHLLLCRQFELARAVRDGVRPALVRNIESALNPLLHEYFASVKGIGFRNVRGKPCDVCGLIDASKQVARSDYSKEFMTYLEQTQNTEGDRLAYDLGDVFQKYVDTAGSRIGRKSIKQMESAVTIMEKIRDLILAARIEASEPESPVCHDDPLEEFADDMASIYERLAALDKPVMRVIH